MEKSSRLGGEELGENGKLEMARCVVAKRVTGQSEYGERTRYEVSGSDICAVKRTRA